MIYHQEKIVQVREWCKEEARAIAEGFAMIDSVPQDELGGLLNHLLDLRNLLDRFRAIPEIQSKSIQ